jgi:DNA-binding HxlR family transcriptional regulator
MTRSSIDVEDTRPRSFDELRVRDCSIKRTLDVIGEKWTLLVLREALYGARRFEQFLVGVGCARTLLSERLATLVEHGVLQREPYREPGQRERQQYLLTEKGHDLFAALIVLMQWGDRWEAGPEGGPVVTRHRGCGEPIQVELRCAHDHRVFDVEETESGSRPGLIDLSNSGR